MVTMDIPRPLVHALSVALCTALLASGLARRAAAQHDAFPQSFRATYLLTARNMEVGTTQWELAPLGSARFAFSSRTEAIGIAKLFRDEQLGERSEWLFNDGRVRPLRYSYSRVGDKRGREVQVDFDWANALVRNTLNGDSWTMPLADGTLDKLVYILAIMNDLGRGMREARYAVADGGKTKTYNIKVVGEEQIDTVLGVLQTTIVERSQTGKSRLTRIWCAGAFGFFPVQLEHIEDDGAVTATLTDLQGPGARQ